MTWATPLRTNTSSTLTVALLTKNSCGFLVFRSVWELGSSNTVLLPAFIVLEVITLEVKPALSLMTRGVGEEHALIMVLTQGLTVRGCGQRMDMHDLILMLVTQVSSPEVILTWQMDSSIITIVKIRHGCSIHTITSVTWPHETISALMICCLITVKV